MKDMLVTRKGIQALQKRRQGYMDRLREVQGQKGPAAEEGTWHDNFSFEDLVRQEGMLNKQIQDIGQLLEKAVTVPDTPSDIRTLQIGHVAHLYIEDDDMTKVCVVGGIGESDLNANPPVIEYDAPLLAPFFGYDEGHEAIVQIGGIGKNVVLETIELRRD